MKTKNIIINIITIICMIISYLIIDLGIRFLSYETYNFYSYKKLSPTLFSLSWITLFIGIFYLLNKKKRKIFYIITLIIFNLIALSQYLHFKILERFYTISDLFLIKEGSKYFKFAIFKCDFKILTIIFLSLIFGFITLKLNKRNSEPYRDKIYFSFIITFTIIWTLIFYFTGYFKLENDAPKNSYAASFTALNIYKDFNNPNKNIQVVGFYENIPRGIYVYIRDKITSNTKETTKKVTTYIKENPKNSEKNKYTGIFKNKNIIVILMESIDTFLINEEMMPTLYNLSKEGLNFINRYSPAFGGGQTINSEFAVNTGLYSSLEGNIYNYDNTYKTSLANKFKNVGYSVNSIHYNNGYYYNRTTFHKNLGYEKHYALSDMKDIDHKNYNYEYDSDLIKNPEVNNLIIRDDKFLSFITTYSTHLPYNASNSRCTSHKYGFIVSGGEEITCIYNLAYDTDQMLKLLIEKLEQEKKLQDTVLVLASDHYMFGYSNIEEAKHTNNQYLLQNTPLIIWNNEIEHKDIDVLVDTTDILPTILNLFDINYDPNLYVGEDAFKENRNNYIYFSEDIYYQDNKMYNRNKSNGELEIYQEIEETIKFNNNLIESNYLKIDN